MSFFLFFIISILSAFGVAVAVVEKRGTFPIRYLNIMTRYWMGKLLPLRLRKLRQALKCTVCTSFWAGLLTDAFLCLVSGFSYFCWPLTGFAALGLTWALIEIVNAIEARQDNIY